jgi:hypothetical protein
MVKKLANQYANAVWIVLIDSIIERWSEKTPRVITYGELRKKISGNSTGSQSMNMPLYFIHKQIKKYSNRSGENVPLLNALVVNATTGEPGDGIPENVKPTEIWVSIRKKGKVWLKEFGELSLGFSKRLDYKGRLFEITTSLNGDMGPKSPHARAESWVIPKHHPAAVAVKAYLEGKARSLVKKPGAKADFFVKFQNKSTVIEVKPDASLQSVATGIGQLLVYGKILGAEQLFLALPDKKLKKNSAWIAVLEEQGIKVLGLKSVRNGKFEVDQIWGANR